MVAAILEGTGMTIDVAKLRRFAEEAGWPSVSPSEFVELLDAYEERDRLRAALQGIVTAIDNHHPKYKYGPFTLTRTEIDAARAALEGRE